MGVLAYKQDVVLHLALFSHSFPVTVCLMACEESSAINPKVKSLFFHLHSQDFYAIDTAFSSGRTFTENEL